MTSKPSASQPPVADSRSLLSGHAASLVLIVVLFASFMDLLDVTIVTVAAPNIAADLHTSQTQLQWVLAAYVLALGSALIVGGRIGDAVGRRRIFLLSLAAFGLTSVACALAPSAGALIAIRALQGTAAGFMIPQVFGIIRSSFAPQDTAKAFGAYGAVQGLASVAGPLLGGGLVDANLWGLGWRTVFWINLPVSTVALALGVRFLPESSTQERSELDVAGALMAAGGIFLVLLPLVQGRDWGWPLWGWGMLVLGVVILALFLWHEKRVADAGKHPILNPELLSIRSFCAGLLAAGFFFGGLASFFLVLSLYLQWGTGRTAWQTGLVILPYALGSIITSGVGVALAARAGRTLVIIGSLTLAGSQLFLWLMVRGDTSPGYWLLASAMFVGGLGLGLGAPILVNVILAGVPGQHAGAAGGVLSTTNQIGGAIGIAVLATVFLNALPEQVTGKSAVETASIYGHAFATVMPWQVAVYLLAALAMLAIPRRALGQNT